ncbi:RNA-processing protein [Candidatus Bathyarchaeota archaeon]|nr:RNA-processing protein [Candidatus Bathyarchaeota archaeon]MDP6047868.1 KH domain-containing protein [Candidatus Bathyarchaeota archaeon]MDP7208023.1 KH domain-containing protein [Candidatus Bathyarchaeota archaeon]MDP7443616.1 KH domain-containing protein [Candidatus Bathyarchaeota archaeon]
MNQKTYLKIPRDRVGALIGPKGKAKRRIERYFGVTLEIDSESGAVEITVNPENSNVTSSFTVRNVVKAIGRGFSPQRAEILAKEDFDLHIIYLDEFVGDSKNTIKRVKGRIIGKNGRSRELIEEITETRISVYGGTIAYIGSPEGLEAAREAIMRLIKGSFHKTVWNYLYAWRRKMKKDKGELWYEKPGQKADLRKR